MHKSKLSETFNRIYAKYHSPVYLKTDPLICVRRFPDPAQIEVAGLLASCLAYGRVERIIHSIESIIKITGNDILSFVNEPSFNDKKKIINGFKHRFNYGHDIALLLETIKYALLEHCSLEKLFCSCLNSSNGTMKSALAGFSSAMKEYGIKIAGKKYKSFEYLFPSPMSGSACKRLNMYLRWMVRKDDGIDLGVWKHVSPSILIIPVDVHVARVARHINLTSRKTPDWKMAEEITEKLRTITPDDPVKYDFSLCRYGMEELRVG